MKKVFLAFLGLTMIVMLGGCGEGPVVQQQGQVASNSQLGQTTAVYQAP